MADDRPHPRLRHAFLPGLIFLVVILATIAATATLWRSAQGRDQARFEAEARVASVAISERLERQIALLRGAAGLFAAGNGPAGSDIDASELETYVARLDLSRRYPGVLGIGYNKRVGGPQQLGELVDAMRATAASDYRVFPEGVRSTYVPVLYLSPLDRRNRAAIGFDMFSDAVRRAAMVRARDDGAPAATGRVTLTQEIDTYKQPGFLIYVPVYRGGRVPVTLGARTQRLDGYVFSPIRAGDLFQTVFSGDEVRNVEVAIYDGAVAPANLLYETGSAKRAEARFHDERVIDVAGRNWVVVTSTLPGFDAGSQRDLAWWAAALGIVTALVLAYAAWAQSRAALVVERARAELRRLNETLEARVEARTAEVSTAYAGLRHEVELRKGAEEQARQMQKMEAVGQLTGGIAHDFNNMLAIVIGNLDLARRRVAEPARLERLLDSAMEGATRAATLTQRLLAFSRRQPLRPECVDINRLIGGMSDLLRRTLGETIQLQTVLGAGAGNVFVDVSQLENAIINLAVNARDAMPGGGLLAIETSTRALDKAYAASNPAVAGGDYIAVTVTDSGEGMPPEVVAKAFDPFFTTKEVGKGTGLGLSQVFGFIQQSGGHVEIDSTPGVGTTIRILLPARTGTDPEDAANACAAPDTRIPRGSSAELILVVEDEDQVRMMSVEALRDLGYTVIHAGGGGEALRMLATHPGVRLLFTDVVMPEMNGRELADAAVEQSPGLKLLFTSGYSQDVIGVNGCVDDRVELMPKPFTFEQLAMQVRKTLDG